MSATKNIITAKQYASERGLHPSEEALNNLDHFLKNLQKSPVYGKGLALPNPGYIWGMSLLFKNGKKGAQQKELARYYAEHNLGEYDGQIRHEARRGFVMASGNSRTTNMEHWEDLGQQGIALVTLNEASSKVVANRTRKMGNLEWQEKVAWFEQHRGGCAMCGTKCKVYDQGHLIRTQPAIGNNVAPLCANCNNWLQAKNKDAEIDSNGILRPL